MDVHAMDSLSVQFKLKDSECLELSVEHGIGILLGCNPGQFSLIFCTASDTLS